MASLPVIKIVMKAVDNVTRQTRQINSSLRAVSSTAAQVGASMSAAFSAPILLAGHNMFSAAVENSKAFNLMKANIKEAETSYKDLRLASASFAEGSLRNVAEVREGMVELGRSGKNTDQVAEMFKPVTNLAIAVDTNVGSSAKTLTNFMNQFQMDVTQTAYAADLMAATVSGSAQNWDDFAASVEHGAAAARTLGMDPEQFVQMDAMLANFGIQGSRLGAQTKAVMKAMVNPETFGAAFGVKTQENGQFRDIIDVYKDVADVMSNMPEAERAEKLVSVFGRIGVTGSAALVANTEQWEKLGEQFADVSGTVHRMSATMGEDLFGAQLAVKNAWGALTEKLLGREGTMVEVLLLKIAEVIKKITSLDTKVLDALATSALALAAAGPALLIISSITQSLAGLPVLGQILSGAGGALATGGAAITAAKGGTVVGGTGLRALVALKGIGATLGKLVPPITIALSVIGTIAGAWSVLKNSLTWVVGAMDKLMGFSDQFGRIKESFEVFMVEFRKIKVLLDPLIKIGQSLVILPLLIAGLAVVLIVLKAVAQTLEVVVNVLSFISEGFKDVMNFITRGRYSDFMDNQKNNAFREFTGSMIPSESAISAINGDTEEDRTITVNVNDERAYVSSASPLFNTNFEAM